MVEHQFYILPFFYKSFLLFLLILFPSLFLFRCSIGDSNSLLIGLPLKKDNAVYLGIFFNSLELWCLYIFNPVDERGNPPLPFHVQFFLMNCHFGVFSSSCTGLYYTISTFGISFARYFYVCTLLFFSAI